MQKTFLLILITLLVVRISAQNIVSGRVFDARTHESLAFVNILANDSRSGCSTDIDGRFTIQSNDQINYLKLSYVGYQTKNFRIDGKVKNLEIMLDGKEVELSEVIILPGMNPAHRIISNAINHKDINNHENLPEFSYMAYEKMVFTVDADSLLQVDPSKLDSSDRELQKFLAKRDFFIIENVVNKKYMAPSHKLDKVVATKVSGFKDPVFVFLLTQLQSSSFYDEVLKIGDKNYINPISNGSLTKYFFQIEDTLWSENDTTFVISFRPLKGKNFDGLKGVLQISNNGWAIRNVIAEPDEETDGLSIRVQQQYKFLPEGLWFPDQMNTDLIFKMAQVKSGQRSMKMLANGHTYIKDINLKPGLNKSMFGHVEIKVDGGAAKRNDDFWEIYRIDSLGARERETYRFIDSVGRKHNFDRMAGVIETLLNARVPMGYVDLDINKLLRYNGYEGFYAGLGLETSNTLSERYKAGGYWGYGFKDKTSKYGGFASLLINQNHDVALRYDYRNDVLESGATVFFEQKKTLTDGAFFRELLVDRMDHLESHKLALSFRTMRYVMFHVSMATLVKKPGYEYAFSSPTATDDVFKFTEATVGFRWAYREKFMQTTRSKISTGTDYPLVYVKFTKGINTFGGEYAYNRFDVSIVKSFYAKYFGKTTIRTDAGWISGNTPICNLFNARAAYGHFTVYSPGSFATMRMNEFYSDRYLALFLSHDFGKLLLRTKHFQPEFEITSNFLIGKMNNLEYHKNIQFKIPEKGYVESGLNIHNLLNMGFYNLGIGAAYRYGTYSLPKTTDNFTVVITMRFKM